MLGLFDIMMDPRYGERQRAFMRLQYELLSSTTDEPVYVWRMPSPAAGEAYDIESNAATTWHGDEWGMLAPTPEWFKNCGNFSIEGGPRIPRLSEAFRVVRQRVQIPQLQPQAFGPGRHKTIIFFATFTCVLAHFIWYLVIKKIKKRMKEGRSSNRIVGHAMKTGGMRRSRSTCKLMGNSVRSKITSH